MREAEFSPERRRYHAALAVLVCYGLFVAGVLGLVVWWAVRS